MGADGIPQRLEDELAASRLSQRAGRAERESLQARQGACGKEHQDGFSGS